MITQDYEKIWDDYSKRFGTTDPTKIVEHLGDEWGTPEFTRQVFERWIAPHLEGAHEAAELGVGGGKYSVLVAPRVQKLYGIDISTQMLQRTGERLKNEKCTFVPVKTQGREVNLPANSVDFFFSIDSMVHLFPYDMFNYVREISKFLRPAGVGVIEFADWDQSRCMTKFLEDVAAFERRGTSSPGAFGFICRQAMQHFVQHVGMTVRKFNSITPRSSVVTFSKG